MGRNKASLSDQPFFVASFLSDANQIAVLLLQLKGCNNGSVSPLFCPAFAGRSSWFAEN